VEVKTLAGAAMPAPWGSNSASTGTVSTTYAGADITVTDQAQKARKSVYDGLGRLASVVEAPGSLNYGTTYGYDVSGNLSSVSQGGQQRTFAYDSLGRLICASNPETRVGSASCSDPLPNTGLDRYSYDVNGNIGTRTDARGVTTTYSYDALNRVISKTYSQASGHDPAPLTPNVTYCYDGLTAGAADGQCTGSKQALFFGRLTQTRSSASMNTVLAYDGLGRVLSSRQTTGGQNYDFKKPDGSPGYAYNLAGGLTMLRLPSGREIQYGYDGAGRPVSALGTLAGITTNYASGISYTAHGAMKSMQIGVTNAVPKLTSTWAFNSRLQGAGFETADANHTLRRLTLDYGTGNNGIVRWQEMSGDGLASAVKQYYTYDAVNRLEIVTENPSNPLLPACPDASSAWCRKHAYDQWGNGWVDQYSNLPPDSFTPRAGTAYNGANRLITTGYDEAGNQTAIGGYTSTYDSEDRLRTVTINDVTRSYEYDGDGRRVKQIVGAETTVFVYDAFGNLAAEYGPAPASSQACQPCYLVTDHLGSTRLVPDKDGNPTKAYDYLPFGEELPSGIAGRGALYGAADVSSLRFTGKERDTETGLDYFGARYFSGAQGRFTSPDPISGTPLHIINPQRWNMYAYAVNNPLSYVDPDGRDAIAVNFKKEVPLGGHEGIISVHANGAAQYARFGPRGGSRPFGEGQVDRYDLQPVQFGSHGLPTDASYKALVDQVAKFEGQDPSTVRMNYFKTSEADTLALDAWIKRLKDASDRRQAPAYDVTRQNCATFCIAGLIQGNAIENRNISIIPNRLFDLLSLISTENYSNGQRTPKEKVTSKICYLDENGKQVCQ
jgi:RHS repeat-associated protein